MSSVIDKISDLEGGVIYTGKVMHMRMIPFKHRFTYKVYSFLFDLDDVSNLRERSRFAGYNSFNLVSFYEKDHIPQPKDGVEVQDKYKTTRDYINSILFDAGVSKPTKIFLLCYPRFLGFVFNPISIYYCFDENNDISAMIYEVRNTFGDRHTYIEPVEANQNDGQEIRHSADKRLHVSPFMDMNKIYHFRVTKPGRNLTFRIFETQGDQPFFSATFSGYAQKISSKNILKSVIRFPFLTLKVVASIHYEALKIWIKGGKYHKIIKSKSLHSMAGKDLELLSKDKPDRSD